MAYLSYLMNQTHFLAAPVILTKSQLYHYYMLDMTNTFTLITIQLAFFITFP